MNALQYCEKLKIEFLNLSDFFYFFYFDFFIFYFEVLKNKKKRKMALNKIDEEKEKELLKWSKHVGKVIK